ncbi:MAG: PEP-utilizing enzyme [Candidatus Woesearchaeota archaeon]
MNIKDNIRSLTWEKWICRDFPAFTASLFVGGNEKKYCDKTGFAGFCVKAQLFQLGYWYQSKEVWQDMVEKLTPILKKKSIFDLTKKFAEFKEVSKSRIKAMVESNEDPQKLLAETYDILTLNTSYIWLAHGLEEYYRIILNREVPKYVKGDVDKFIGDASFPIKKNAHSLMEEEIRAGKDCVKIAEKYGWLKTRGFGKPLSVKEIEEMKKNLSEPEKQAKVKVPKELKQLFKEMQELVFYRTERTDLFYELLYLAQPIFKKVAEKFKIPYEEFPNYTIQSLISGDLVRLNQNPTMATFEEEFYLGNKTLIADEKNIEQDYVKGNIAQKGIVKGIVRIVKNSSELDKVKKGDILVTPMTFPAFIQAMVKAAAFVTDEGGLTCHAAIVAREMKKPCIIGTKIATKIFKDGDLVEVDADKGVVRKVGD